MRPAVAVPVLAAIAAMTALTGLVLITSIAAGFLARFGVVSTLIAACPAIPVHHGVGYVLGVPAVVALVVVAVRMKRIVAELRRAIHATQGQRLCIRTTQKPLAFAVPGSPGCVVVSTGMMNLLEPRERQVLFAHERAHLSQNHHRYLLVGALSQSVVPALAPLLAQLRLATERCADEAAATAMGGDRDVVATAIARAALGVTAHQGLVGAFGGGSVPTRVEALLATPQPRRIVASGALLALVALAATAAALSLQVHHVAAVIAHVCAR